MGVCRGQLDWLKSRPEGGGGGEGGDEGEGRGQRKRKRGESVDNEEKAAPGSPAPGTVRVPWVAQTRLGLWLLPRPGSGQAPWAHVDSAAALRADTVTTGTCEHVRCRRGSEDAERRAELACSGWVRCACRQPPPHSPCPSEGRRVPSTPPADCGINKGPDRSPSCPRCF